MLFIKLLLVVFFVACYVLGGQGLRWTRKWVGPAVFGGSLLLLSLLGNNFSFVVGLGCAWYLLAANSFAYGDKFTKNKTGLKILFRGLCGLMYGIAGLLIGLGSGHTLLGFAQIFIAPAASILFGVLNPFPNKWGNWATIAEDCCIATAYVALIPFII